MTTRSAGSGDEAEAGTGLVATLFGVLVFLSLMLLAVQVLFGLYARSAVTAAAYDAARVVAGSDGGPGSVGRAEENARAVLGRYGARTSFEWSAGADTVRLHVRARTPSLLPAFMRRPLRIDTVDRTVELRTERIR